MSADTVATGPAVLEDGPSGSLLRSEVRRLTHRRFIRWLVLIGAVVYAGILVIAWFQYEKTTPESLARAQQRMQEIVDEQNSYLAECSKNLPPGEDPEMSCGTPMTVDQMGDPADYVAHGPFTMDSELPAFSLGMAALLAAICFLVGATAIGAEWSQKSLMALLFWEPRRLKVFTTKVAVVAVAVTVLAALSQLLLIPVAYLFAHAKGTSEVSPGFWGDLFPQMARGVLLVLLVCLIGFGIANLVRNTAAALGAGFVYFVAEVVMQNVRPMWQPWYLTTNAAALVNNGGLTVSWGTSEPVRQPDGSLAGYKEVVLTNLHGGLVIGAVALALLVLGGWLFRQRDLT